jgi:hypothetical protein
MNTTNIEKLLQELTDTLSMHGSQISGLDGPLIEISNQLEFNTRQMYEQTMAILELVEAIKNPQSNKKSLSQWLSDKN